MALRRRQNVLNLVQEAQWDPILEWYAKAVVEMSRRPIDDPTSWRYQASVHAYPRFGDPLERPRETLPPETEQKRFWDQCQHHTWYFLPWHRMYLAFFEQIVGKTIEDMGGPSDWALPYWNYCDTGDPRACKLPPAFIAHRTPDGGPNPLRSEHRRAGNGGEDVATKHDIDLEKCLVEPAFEGLGGGGGTGFGGMKTKPNHKGGDKEAGMLEAVPHESIHSAIGDWMRFSSKAPLDPLFWLHHANIDRLWVVWRRRRSIHTDPTDVVWLREFSFYFHDAERNVVSMTPEEVVDTAASPLEYEYDDVSDPIPGAPLPHLRSRRVPEMVGSTAGPILLTLRRTNADVPLIRPTGPAARASTEDRPDEAYLNFENIAGSGESPTYAVYLNLLDIESADQHEETYAGQLPMFGLEEASRSDEQHPGSGLGYVLNITDVVQALDARGRWNADGLRVTFVPEHAIDVAVAGAGSSAVGQPAVTVGRVSLYYVRSE